MKRTSFSENRSRSQTSRKVGGSTHGNVDVEGDDDDDDDDDDDGTAAGDVNTVRDGAANAERGVPILTSRPWNAFRYNTYNRRRIRIHDDHDDDEEDDEGRRRR